jgi:hypothetical protein
MMSSKYGLLSFFILGLILLLIFKNYEIWTQPIEWVPEKNIGMRPPSKPESKPEVLSTFGTQKNPTSVKSYISIAEKNVFSPERKDFPIPMGNGKRQLVRPQIILYGVTIAGDYQVASVANPGRPLQKGERETFTVRKGERIGEYKLVKILSDRVTLEAEGDTFEVLLYDSKMPKRRMDVKTDGRPATVTSTQPIPAGPVPGIPAPALFPTPTWTPRSTPPAVQGGVATPSPSVPVSPSLPPPSARRGRIPYYPPSYSPPSGNPIPPEAPTGTPAGTPMQETGGN